MDFISTQLQHFVLWIASNIQAFWNDHIIWIVFILIMFYFKRLWKLAMVLVFLAALGLYNPILFWGVFLFSVGILFGQFCREGYGGDDINEDDEGGDDDDEI